MKLSRRSTRGPPESWFTFFGLVVVRRTDLLAAAAFVLSLSTVGYQAWQFVRGANPQMYHPDTVYIIFDKYANGVVGTRFAGQLSFTNDGEPGHNAIIRDVRLSLQLGEKTINEKWFAFANITRDDVAIKFDIKEPAHPFVVAGGGASSYLATFAPAVKDCGDQSLTCNQAEEFVSDTDFLQLLSEQKLVYFRFAGSVFGTPRPLESRCKVSVTPDLLTTLAANGWYAVLCASAP